MPEAREIEAAAFRGQGECRSKSDVDTVAIVDEQRAPIPGRLRVVQVIAGLDPMYGGPSYSVPRLCQALAAATVETELLSVASAGAARSDESAAGYRDRRFAWNYARVPVLRGLRLASGLARELRHAASAADVIHDHGLWLIPNLQAGWAALRARKPFVVSPRGMLSAAALDFSPRKKRAVWALFQASLLRRAACIHATSEQEYEEIRRLGLRNPVAIIPNGVDVPEDSAAPPSAARERTVLSLGRMHPKKGLKNLLGAWASVETAHPSWHLRIVGPSEDGQDIELRALARRLGILRISIEGPLYGDAKQEAYQNADLFVLPSLNENFGLTVAEALASGTPAIATRGTPWSGMAAAGCGWWIDQGVEPLAAALTRAMALPQEELGTMGGKGRAWIEREFSWVRIARDMSELYAWLAGRSPAPGCVRFD